MADSPPGSGDVVVHVGAARLDLSPPPKPDGYKEVAYALQAWAAITGYHGRRDHFWLVLMAARRLDSAHRQLERTRAGLDDLKNPKGSPQQRAAATLAVIGDAQLTMVALYRAASASQRVAGAVTVPFPSLVTRKMRTLEELRHAFEHVDDRALGFVSRGVRNERAAWNSIVSGGRAVISARRVRYRRWSLGLDQPATDLCVALRRFLRNAWLELT
jgi:hypothetical protein